MSFRQGDKVIVTAKDENYACIDGFVGAVSGCHWEGATAYVIVMGYDAYDGHLKTFYVPADQLRLTV